MKSLKEWLEAKVKDENINSFNYSEFSNNNNLE